jgi:adenine-specific DNA-methyltransferase
MRKSGISDDLYFFLLASLLENADKLANTTALYTAYLKHLIPAASKPLVLEPAHYEITQNKHQVYNEDANTLIKRISGDILYLDPPYNTRHYSSAYHILNTIALYDNFVPQGKTGRREYNKSNWCYARTVEKELDDLLRNAQFKYIFLSYNNEGLMSPQTIEGIMKRYGDYDCATTNYKRFKSDRRAAKTNSVTEYIHILKK